MATDPREGPVRSLTIAGLEGNIAALVAVPEDLEPRAPVAICVHGSGCTGRYFDLSVNSWLRAAHGSGVPALALDRPAHGGSSRSMRDPLSAAREAILATAQALPNHVPTLAERGIVLVGHSFGGAAALFTAGELSDRGVDLIGLCMSGIGDVGHVEYRGAGQHNGIPASYWLFGPGRTYDFRGVAALRAASTTWQADEIAELRERWPARFPTLAAGVTVPVHFRLAEHERIWDASEEGIQRVVGQFAASPRIDAAMLPEGGHLYEVHSRGPALVADQLAFIRAIAGMVGK